MLKTLIENISRKGIEEELVALIWLFTFSMKSFADMCQNAEKTFNPALFMDFSLQCEIHNS